MKKILLISLCIALGTALGIWLEVDKQLFNKLPMTVQSYLVNKVNKGDSLSITADSTQDTPIKKERKILYWVEPMDPTYRRDKPGKSPMGMDLVPVYEDEKGGQDEANTVKISPTVINNLGVRTAIVSKESLSQRIETVGYVTYNESHISHIHLRTKGWIEQLVVKVEGESVSKGELLFKLYSPDLVNAQQEFLQALGIENKNLIMASENRLLTLGMSPAQIKQFKSTRTVIPHINIYAPQSGIVSDLDVREGMYVKPDMTIMSLVDLSSVWLMAEVFERQANWVKVGQTVEASLSFIPNKVWKGTIDFIYPKLNAMTRTVKVRLRFDNPNTVLKPNMYAHITLYNDNREISIAIPTLALIRGEQENRVIIAKDEGRFEVRKVTIGIESGDKTEVISGVEEGEKVVISAQFLIDSEASLQASFLRMSTPESQETESSTEKSQSTETSTIMGMGVVNHIDNRKITISHEAIESLGWGAMTMDFSVSNSVDLTQVHVGNKIHFTLKKVDEYKYEIQSIHVYE